MIITLLLSLSAFGGTQTYKYQPQTGQCVNAMGQPGLNEAHLDRVFEFDPGHDLSSDTPIISNQNLECANLRNLNFRSILNSDARYVVLKNWNLRGANMAGSDITWMVLAGGSIDGVDFRSTELGYTIFQDVHIDRRVQGLRGFCIETQQNSKINCQM